MKNFLLTTASIFISILVNAQAPTFEWAKSIGGYYGYSRGNAVVVDATGNIYTAGTFSGRIDFDPGPGSFNLTALGNSDGFVTKKDASGNFIWAIQFQNSFLSSIVKTGTGNICIAGRYSGTVDFDPGAAANNLTATGGSDIFICMLNSSGNLIWVRSFGSTWNDAANDIAIDGSNNIFTIGEFRGSVDFDPGTPLFLLSSGGNSVNTFISKLNSAGNFVYAKQLSGGAPYGMSIDVDQSGNVYAAGHFSLTTDFDPGTGVFNLTCFGSTDAFVLRLNFSGNFIWAKQLGGASSDNASSVKLDVASGNIYTVGTFRDTGDFNPGIAVSNLISDGYYDNYISKLDASGNYMWAARIGNATNSETVSDVLTDLSGNIYIMGSFLSSVDFDPGAGVTSLTCNFTSTFFLKLNSTGVFSWVKAINGTDNLNGFAMTMDASNNIYATGAFEGICDFDPGIGSFTMIASGFQFMFNTKFDSAGNFTWAKSAGEGSSTITQAMTTDPAGNVYTTGYFTGTIDVDPGPGILNFSTISTDLAGDVFVTKINSAGNLIWAKQMGGPAHDYPTSIVVDPGGNVYTVGSFKQTADFNPGPATFNLTSSSTNYDIFVSKLNASGNFIWAKKLGSTSIEDVYDIALDASGNLITAGGYFPGTNAIQIYLNKLDPAGNTLWSKIYGGTSSEEAYSIATDATGNIYITGYFQGTTDFDPGTGISNLTTTGYQDAFISKLNSSGNFVWAKQLTGAGNATGTAITLDGSGQIHSAGYFDNTVDFDPGAGVNNMTSASYLDVFISKLDNSGNFVWAKQFAGANNEYVKAIAVDNTGNVYTTGTFTNVDFDPGPGTFNMTSAGSSDVFISKLNAIGNFVWAQQIGGLQNDQVYALALDASSNIYTAGTFLSIADFDPGAGISNLTANGNPDLFIHKLRQCISPAATVIPSGPTTFCVGESVTLNANTGAGLTYQWMRNGVNIAGATTSSYVATLAGNYSVFVSDAQPCTAASNNIHVSVPCVPVDTSQQRMNQNAAFIWENINLFPNPSSGIFTINSPKGELQIFNAYGQLVYTSTLQTEESKIDLSNFPDGIYLLQLKSENNLFARKIILNR